MSVLGHANGFSLTDLKKLAAEGDTLELVEGDLFVSPPITPYLDGVIHRIVGALRRFAEQAPEAVRPRVVTEVPVGVTPRTVLIPDVSLIPPAAERLSNGELRPSLVVEVRTESTDRYALGPKRLFYARGKVPDYWFVDPRAGILRTFRLIPGEMDYRWPPHTLEAGEEVDVTYEPLSKARLAVADLLPPILV